MRESGRETACIARCVATLCFAAARDLVVARWLPAGLVDAAPRRSAWGVSLRITKRSAEAAKPRAGTAWVQWDDLSGFGLRVRSTGSKAWVVKYRHEGRQRWYTIGSYPKVAPDAARDAARKLLADVAHGRDPAAERARARRALTVQQAADRFLVEHVEVHCSASTQRNFRSHLERLVVPELGTVKLRSVIREDVKRLHRKHKATPVLANRMLTTLSRLFTWAEECGVLPEGCPNPVRGVKRNKEQSRQVFLGDAEIQALGKSLREAERNRSEHWQAIGAIRLLLLTGCRLREILDLRWEHVDLEARLLHLKGTKSGDRAVVLSAPAAQVLEGLPRSETCPWVFPGGRSSGGPWQSLWGAWGRISANAGFKDVRLHDLRHSHASAGIASGLSLAAVGALLGHKTPTVTNRYAHLGRDPRREAAEKVGSRIAAALNREDAAQVVLLGRRV